MYKVMIAFIFLWLTLLVIKALIDIMETEIIYGRKFVMGKHDRRKKYFDDILDLIGSEKDGNHDISTAKTSDDISEDLDAIVEEYLKTDIKSIMEFAHDNELLDMQDENKVIFE